MQIPFTDWRIDATTPILVRIDGNVPHEEGIITDDFRLRQVMPTINSLYQRGCPVLITTHINRPGGTFDPQHTTAMIADWMHRQGYHVEHVPYDGHNPITQYIQHIKPQPRTISVLDNLRFFPGEKDHDTAFIQALQSTASWYINDAWGMMHRNDSSVLALAQEYDRNHRSYGHLVDREISALSPLRNEPQQPYVVICGGAKISSKLPIIKELIHHRLVNTLIITPGMAGTFLRAQGYSVGMSLYEEEYIDTARSIIEDAQKAHITIDIPQDVYIVEDSWNNQMYDVSVGSIPENGIMIASGPKTLQRYHQYIDNANTIFLNGPMGDIRQFHTISPFQRMLTMIQNAQAYRVVGGGDSVATINILAIDPFDFYSTGGGATLAYISRQTLPALDILS